MSADARTVWRRLEPHARSADLAPGLAAQCADPLWFVTRQLQLGELTGSDGGSPVLVDVERSWSRITRARAAAPEAETVVVDEASGPLEALVEREAELVPGDGGAWAPRVRAGRDLDRRLHAHGLGAVAAQLRSSDRTRFQAAARPDRPESRDDVRYRTLLRGRVIDAGSVLGLLADGDLPADVVGELTDEQRRQLRQVLADWRAAMDGLWGIADAGVPAGHHPATWADDRCEYAFTLAAPPLPGDQSEGEVVLRADDYDGTGLDWYAVDLVADPAARGALGAATGADAADATGRAIRTVLATPLTFPGAPADRFWEFEDGAVSLGVTRAGPTSLARLVTVEFAVVYSPDWFLVPLDFPVGCVARVDSVVVRDTFGVATLVGTTDTHAGDGEGRQFQPSTAGDPGGDNPLLVVMPSSLGTLRSAPRERVAFQRDELANLAWAIEHVVAGAAGRGVEHRWSPAELELPDTDAAEPGDLVWRLATPVPSTWVPLVPGFVDRQTGERQALGHDGITTADGRPPTGPRVLVQADLLDPTSAAPRPSTSELLAGFTHIRDEEVTGRGLDVTVHHQLARWHDGGTFVWRGRERRSGRGGAASGLRYDETTPPPRR